MDANLLHTSYEGKSLEDPWERYDESMLTRTVSVENAPDKPQEIIINFEKGDPVSINEKKKSPAELLTQLNEIGGKNGIGRIDIVENRYME